MLLIPTQVAPSGIHGNGLFTVTPIAQGTPLYRFLPGFDQVFAPGQWAALPELARGYVRHFSYLTHEADEFILSGDHARFMNHADEPNTGAASDDGLSVTTVALRDLAAGEELTCDYRKFDGDVAWKLGLVARDAPPGTGRSGR